MSNGKNLSLMTEDEFVNADPEISQRWTYRMLCSICSDIKGMKKKSGIHNKAWSFAGGVLGGFLAFFVATKVKLLGQ